MNSEVNLEYWDGTDWVPCGTFGSEHIAWASLVGDSLNYRTVDAQSGTVLTDKQASPLSTQHRMSAGSHDDNLILSCNILSSICYELSSEAGWWTNVETGEPLERNKGEMLCLIHSEVSECLEGVRKNCMDTHLKHRKMEEVELADAIIRIFDYAGGFGLDVGGALVEKLKYNIDRSDHKMSNRLKSDGKKI